MPFLRILHLLLFGVVMLQNLQGQTTEQYFNRGLAKYELEDYRGAIQDFSKVIELDSRNVIALGWRGMTKYQLGDYRGAIQDLSKAIELDSRDARAYMARGLVKVIMGDTDSGCLDLSRAGELGDFEAYDAIKKICN